MASKPPRIFDSGEEAFGFWLKRQRTRRRMTQGEVASVAGISPAYVSLIERTAGTEKEPQPKQHVVAALARAIDVPEREALMAAGYYQPNPLASPDAELEIVRLADGRSVTIVGLDAPREDKELIKALIRRLMDAGGKHNGPGAGERRAH